MHTGGPGKSYSFVTGKHATIIREDEFQAVILQPMQPMPSPLQDLVALRLAQPVRVPSWHPAMRNWQPVMQPLKLSIHTEHVHVLCTFHTSGRMGLSSCGIC